MSLCSYCICRKTKISTSAIWPHRMAFSKLWWRVSSWRMQFINCIEITCVIFNILKDPISKSSKLSFELKHNVILSEWLLRVNGELRTWLWLLFFRWILCLFNWFVFPQVYFAVMSNVLQSDLHLHRRYDLKGSSRGRNFNKVIVHEEIVYKDIDLDFYFYLEPSLRNKILS